MLPNLKALPGSTRLLVGLDQEIGHVAAGEIQQGVRGVLDALLEREEVEPRRLYFGTFFHLSVWKGQRSVSFTVIPDK